MSNALNNRTVADLLAGKLANASLTPADYSIDPSVEFGLYDDGYPGAVLRVGDKGIYTFYAFGIDDDSRHYVTFGDLIGMGLGGLIDDYDPTAKYDEDAEYEFDDMPKELHDAIWGMVSEQEKKAESKAADAQAAHDLADYDEAEEFVRFSPRGFNEYDIYAIRKGERKQASEFISNLATNENAEWKTFTKAEMLEQLENYHWHNNKKDSAYKMQAGSYSMCGWCGDTADVDG